MRGTGQSHRKGPQGKRLTGRRLKPRVIELLKSGELTQSPCRLPGLNVHAVANVLFSTLLSQDQQVKWSSVTAMGMLVSGLADEDMESARNMMRRLMWSLNDESGGIGWGAPEAMGEIMACHGGLAREFAPILISYVREDGNFLEYEPLRRGVVWGLGRLAQVRSDLLRSLRAIQHLLPFLHSSDASVRGLTVWALGLLAAREAQSRIEGLLTDSAEVPIYMDGAFVSRRVNELAKEALDRICNAIHMVQWRSVQQ